jgi:hypothetical protein
VACGDTGQWAGPGKLTGNLTVISQGFANGSSTETNPEAISDNNAATIEQEGGQNKAQFFQGNNTLQVRNHATTAF